MKTPFLPVSVGVAGPVDLPGHDPNWLAKKMHKKCFGARKTRPGVAPWEMRKMVADGKKLVEEAKALKAKEAELKAKEEALTPKEEKKVLLIDTGHTLDLVKHLDDSPLTA